jgi:hypothetical protein
MIDSMNISTLPTWRMEFAIHAFSFIVVVSLPELANRRSIATAMSLR